MATWDPPHALDPKAAMVVPSVTVEDPIVPMTPPSPASKTTVFNPPTAAVSHTSIPEGAPLSPNPDSHLNPKIPSDKGSNGPGKGGDDRPPTEVHHDPLGDAIMYPFTHVGGNTNGAAATDSPHNPNGGFRRKLYEDR